MSLYIIRETPDGFGSVRKKRIWECLDGQTSQLVFCSVELTLDVASFETSIALEASKKVYFEGV